MSEDKYKRASVDEDFLKSCDQSWVKDCEKILKDARDEGIRIGRKQMLHEIFFKLHKFFADLEDKPTDTEGK